MLRILVADDHPIFRRGVRQIVAETSDMVITDEASNVNEVYSKMRANDYDVVLLDISWPGQNGLDVLKTLKDEKPLLPVLILSMHPEEQYAVRALKAGASGYLTKESAAGELITAIRKVYKGGKYISASLGERLAAELQRNHAQPPHETLSDREYQVMSMIASGKTVAEIARDLSLSVKTISTYRMRILEKMSLKNNAELTHYALQNHLVS